MVVWNRITIAVYLIIYAPNQVMLLSDCSQNFERLWRTIDALDFFQVCATRPSDVFRVKRVEPSCEVCNA